MELLATKKIDELGRISLSEKSRNEMGWATGDTIAVYHVDKNTLILQLSEKYPGQKCIFCGTTESAVTISGKDICRYCLEKANAAN